MSQVSFRGIARTTVPRALASEVIRMEALAQLSVPDRPSVVLLAPSGYGKTTLLAQYARNTTRTVIWLSLGPGDEEAGTFKKNLHRALQGVLDGMEEDPTSSLMDFLDWSAERLSQEERSVDIVLDRVEHVARTHGTALATLIGLLPEGHRLLMAGLDLQGFPLARLTASGQIDVLSTEQLRFTAQEAGQLLTARESSLDIDQLMATSEGWPVSISLSLMDSAAQVDVNQLLQDALEQLPEELQAVLPELALFDEWGDELGELLESPLPAAWLSTLRRAGLPLTPLGRGLYRPHMLLLKLLEKQLQRTPEKSRRIHLLRATLAVQEQDLSTAIRHARQAHQADLMELYAQELFPTLHRQREFKLLEELSALHPGPTPAWWEEFQAIARIEIGEGDKGLAQLEGMKQQQKLTGLGFAALALQAARQGDFEGQLSSAQQGLALAAGTSQTTLSMQLASALISLERFHDGEQVTEKLISDAQAQRNQLAEADALNMHQYTLLMQRRWPEREAVLQRARTVLLAHGQQRKALQMEAELSEVLLRQGRHEEAALLISECIELALRTQPIHLPTLYQTLARYKMIRGDWEGAAQSLLNAEDTIHRLKLPVVLPFLHANMFDLYSAIGEKPRAQRAYEQLVEHTQRPIFKRYLLPLFTGIHALDAGDLTAAETHLRVAAQESVEQTHALRAQLLLLAIQQSRGTLLAKEIEESRQALEGLDITSVIYADQRHLMPLRQFLTKQAANHPLVTGEVRQDGPKQEELLRVEVGRKIEAWVGDKAVKLPLAKSGELLFWLLWRKQGTLHDILNDLWDGSRDPKHHEYFRVVVRRLRQMLKEALDFAGDPIPYSQGTYSLQPELRIVLNLQAALGAAQQGEYEALLSLPIEGLAGDLTAEWVDGVRETIRRDQIYALGEIESRLVKTQPAQAVALLKLAVRAQPAEGETHLALIRTLLSAQPSEASSAFQVYRSMLEKEYGESPSRETLRQLRDLGLNTG
jgi:LuxR family maltose regulon positive regulatory protein